MKTLIFTALMAFSASALAWGDSVTVINPSHRTSPAAVFAQSYKDAVDASYYQAQDCEDAGRKYDATENAVFIYNSSIEFAARNKGLDCLLENVKDKTVVFTGQHYFKICRRPGTDVTLEPNGKAGTMGIASMLATKSHENTFKTNDVDVTIVPFSGSKTVARALIAGDVDLGFMGQGIAANQGDRVECLYSTNPAADNYLQKTVGVAVPDFHISYVVYTNSKDPKVLEALRNVENTKSFQTYLQKSMTTGNFNATNTDASVAVEYVQRMYKNWADN